MEKRNALAVGKELESCLKACVSATNDGDIFTIEQGPIARSAVGKTLLVKLFRTGDVKRAAACACRYENGPPLMMRAVFYMDDDGIFSVLKRNGARGPEYGQEITRVCFHMFL